LCTRDGAFADAALGGCDGDDVGCVWDLASDGWSGLEAGEEWAGQDGRAAPELRSLLGRGEGVAWRSGVEWSGMEWSGMEWNGVEWSGMGGVEWNGIVI